MTSMMIEAAARGLLFALAVGAGLRMFGVRNVPVRKAAWSVVLMASLAMPFLMQAPAVAAWKAQWGWSLPLSFHPLVGVAPNTAIAPVRVHQAPAVLTVSDHARTTLAPKTSSVLPAVVVSTNQDFSLNAGTPEANAAGKAEFQWPSADRWIVMLYLGVAGLLMIRLLWGLAMAVRLWMTADRVSPLVAPEPNVRSSVRVPSPVTIGSGIVLPANYVEWDRRKLRMVIAHERSHVRQMDFYLQLLAGLYAALFWFSPLGWWLRRTLVSLGEAIGDRAGMNAATSRSGYAEVLLEFAAMPRQTLPGVAMARPGNLSPRVERLLNEKLFRSAFAEGRRRAVASLLIVPAALFAATVLIRIPGAAAQTAPPAPQAPAPPLPAAGPELAPVAAPAALSTQAPVPPPAPEAPTSAGAPAAPSPDGPPSPAIAPGAPLAPNARIALDDSPDPVISNDEQDLRGYTYGFSDDGESYAIVDGPDNDVTFSGSWDSARRAEIDAARKIAKGPFLWFTHEGKSYIVTDPATIARIRKLYEPMEELGRRQGLLGKQQEALGNQMEELSREQESAVQVKIPDLSKEMADLDREMAKFKAEQAALSTKDLDQVEKELKAAQDKMVSPERIAELQSELASAQSEWNSERMATMQERMGELQERLGQLQGEAGARQGEFGAKMGALGSEQGRIGAQQGRLGAEQGRIAREADRQVRSIVEESLRNGTASQVAHAQ